MVLATGDAWARWLITPLQYSVMIGLAVAYLVTAGQSFQVRHSLSACFVHNIAGHKADWDQTSTAGFLIAVPPIQLFDIVLPPLSLALSVTPVLYPPGVTSQS